MTRRDVRTEKIPPEVARARLLAPNPTNLEEALELAQKGVQQFSSVQKNVVTRAVRLDNARDIKRLIHNHADRTYTHTMTYFGTLWNPKFLNQDFSILSFVNDLEALRKAISIIPLSIKALAILSDSSLVNTAVADSVYRLPEEIQNQLATTGRPIVRVVLTKRTDLSSKMLSKLSADTEAVVRVHVARREDITKKIWDKLVQDENLNVVRALALNSKVPDDIRTMASLIVPARY